jgi:multicomponent Na+:H+ antiporter subunit C
VTPNLVLSVLVGILFATGVYLLLARSITRALIGILLMSNGANILFLVASGRAGRAPIVGGADDARMSDPLPQALVLTAIVLTMGMTAFILAMAHRSWQLGKSDVVEDDVEDVKILRRAEADDLALSDFVGDELDDEGPDDDVLLTVPRDDRLDESPKGISS